MAVDLSSVKKDLRVTHGADDDLIQQLIDSAEDEALRFMNRDELPTADEESSEPQIAPSVFTAICCLVKAGYEATPTEAEQLRKAAEVKLMPYRLGLGV